MSFLESPRFPDRISFGATGGPAWLTNIVINNAGYEYRSQNWEHALCSYDVAHAARHSVDYVELRNFFRAVRGRMYGFRFKDWADYVVASGEGTFIPVGFDSPPTSWQMCKAYAAGSFTEYRKILKPVSGTVTVATSSGAATVDYITGVVTVSASGSPISWTGNFDVPCRFDTDQMRGEIIDKEGNNFIMGWQAIPIREIRV